MLTKIISMLAMIMLMSVPYQAEIPAVVIGLSSGDYPSWALRNNEGGRVKMALSVERNGTITSCKIAGSSGNSKLDAYTCAIFTAKVRYAPDATGDQRTFETSMNWRLPGMSRFDPLLTFHLGSVRPIPIERLSEIMHDSDIFNCRLVGGKKFCEVPPIQPQYRQDMPAAGKLTIVAEEADNRFLGLYLEKGNISPESFENDIRSQWGNPCYFDATKGVKGWIAGNGYIVLTNNTVVIGLAHLDEQTAAAADICPPLFN